MSIARGRARVEAVDTDAAVTPLELFFDLVFVFGLVQITTFMAADLSWRGLLHGVLIIGLLWWSWVCYAWVGNVARADEGLIRLTMFGAMATMFVLALSIPEAFDDVPGGLPGPMVVALCYFLFRALHIVVFWIISTTDAGLRAQVKRFLPATVAGTALLLVAAMTHGTLQTALWAAALVADYLGNVLGGARGWRIRSVSHFAERHGLIVIIALGESIASIGVGVVGAPISWPIVAAAVLGLTLCAALWWAYFDVTSLLAERAFAACPPDDRARFARDAYSYLHLPLVAGIVLLALGLKKVLASVGDTAHHELTDPLQGVSLFALVGGVVLYLLGHVAFKLRSLGVINVPRVGVAVALLALLAAAAQVPALALLAILTAAVVARMVFETWHLGEERVRIRHAHD